MERDEEEVYAPVAKHATLRTLIGVANQFKMETATIDVITAFLYGKIEEGKEVYMEMPQGYEKEGKTCRLKKSIYGLRSSSKQWNKCIHDYLSSKGFVRSKNDLCLYIHRIGKAVTYVLLYVDDIFVVCSDVAELNRMKADMSERFKITDLSRDSRFLGVDITWNRERGEVTLSQSRYIQQVLSKFRMSDCNAVKTPMLENIRIEKDKDEPLTKKPYRQLIGCLSYIACMTRPDINFAVNRLSQFQECATDMMYEQAKRILRYLKGSIDLKLHYSRGDEFEVVGYADADFGSDTSDRKSRMGYVFLLGGNAVSWKSVKQNSVALSTAEAEYIALSTAITEGLWLKQLLVDLNINCDRIVMKEDNKNAILFGNNNDNNKSRCKHIDVRYRFINDEIQKGNVKVEYVRSEYQTADIFTKALNQNFIRHRESLRVI